MVFLDPRLSGHIDPDRYDSLFYPKVRLIK